MTKFKTVRVVWHDAWQEHEQVRVNAVKQPPLVIDSVGFLMVDDKDEVAIAQQIVTQAGTAGEPDRCPDARHTLHIPRAMVISFEILKPASKSKPGR